MLYDWMAEEYRTSPSSSNTSFVKNLALSGEGCMRILIALKAELNIVCLVPNKLRRRDKLLFMWNQSRVKDLEGHINSQTLGLMLLLACREFSQRQSPVIQSSEDRKKMKIVQQHNDELHKTAGDSVEKLLGAPSSRAPPTESGSVEQAEDPEELRRYQAALSYLSESARLPETSQPSENAITKLPKISFAEKIRAEYQEKVAKDLECLVPECPKLRILVIGRVGAGKSTLCGKLLGLSDQTVGVSDFGTGTPVERIWEPLTGPENPHLILNDSGGFEGSPSQTDEVEAFIKSRRAQKELQDQLHCIFYCISCVGGRPFQQGAEKWFLDQVDTGNIPVFIVFTHYDAIIERQRQAWRDQSAKNAKVSEEKGFAIAEAPAFTDYRQKYEAGILELIKGKPNVKICRLSIRKGKEYGLQKYPHIASSDIASLSDLTEAVCESLHEAKGLEMTWIALQRIRADLKLKASLAKNIDQYWKVQTISKIPLIPIICLATLGQAYNTNLRRLSQIWGLKTQPADLLTCSDNLDFGFLEATFDQSTGGIIMTSALIATYNLGPLTSTQTARIILRIIVGLTLIFEQLFLHQQKQGDDAPPLTKETIRVIARNFQHSTGRKQMAAQIDFSIVWDTRHKLEKVRVAAEKAMAAGKSKFNKKASKNEYALWNALKDDDLPVRKSNGGESDKGKVAGGQKESSPVKA